MPIAPVFPGVTTGGSTGVSLLNMTAEVVDLTDGSWTLLDPDSLIDSVSFSSGYNTITWNALGSGSNDYTWTNSPASDRDAPRWYKTLAIDGTTVTSDDSVVFTSLIAMDVSVNTFQQAIVMAIADDASSRAVNTINLSGALSRRSSGNVFYGAIERQNQTSTSNANHTRVIASTLRSAARTAGTSFVSLDASNARVANGVRAGNISLASGRDQHVMVGVGTYQSSSTFIAQTINTAIV